MSHLVKPRAHRAGKTFLWSHNTVSSSTRWPQSPTLSQNSGLDALTAKLLKRKRLYFIKGVIAKKNRLGVTHYNFLFAPKMKSKPRFRKKGSFIKRGLYRPIDLTSQLEPAIAYIKSRQEKKAPRRKRFIPNINRWLTRRMFRGSTLSFKSSYLAEILEQRKNKLWKIAYNRLLRSKSLKKQYCKHKSSVSPSSRILLCLNALGSAVLQNSKYKRNFSVKSHKKLTKRLSMKKKLKIWTFFKLRHKWASMPVWQKFKKSVNYHRWTDSYRIESRRRRRFNERKFSYVLSTKLSKPTKIKALNVFSYLVDAGVIGYKNHQQHFWHPKYRRFRFHYKNYFDIVNAFFIIPKIQESWGFLLSILKITLPLILKIKRFFWFLSALIKNMAEIRHNFSVFKVAIAGKIAGGTKRTKSHSIGYGVLPIQTLSVNAVNIFLSYTHIYGEFGIKFLICKDDFKLRNAVQAPQ